MSALPWFRAYTEMVDDEKLRLLAFEDRWHFIALLCLKGQGVIDEAGPLLFRKVAVKLGLDVRSVEEVARRLEEVGLIDEKTLQPLAWEGRQFQSDSSAARVAAYRERKKQGMKRDCNVTVTAQDTDTDTDKEEEKEKKKRVTAPPLVAEKASKAKTLTAYLADCKSAGTKPVPDAHSIRTWATEAGITPEMLQIAWVQFRERYTEAEKGKGKRYKDWPGHFATAVKANWFKLWFSGDNGMQWSSVGMTHKTVLDARMAQKEVEHA